MKIEEFERIINLESNEEFIKKLNLEGITGNAEYKRILRKEGKLFSKYFSILLEKWRKSSKTPEDIKKLRLAVLIQGKRSILKLTREELAIKLNIKLSALKSIEQTNGSIKSIRANRELRKKICSELEILPAGLNKILGLELEKTGKYISLEDAKKSFADALQNSDNYQEFFINVFKITQDFKVFFQEEKARKDLRKKKLSSDKIIKRQHTDEQLDKHLEYEKSHVEFIDQLLNEVDLMGNIGKLKQSKYARFFLDVIYDNAETKNEIELLAKQFFQSKVLQGCSNAGLKKALSSADKNIQKEIYKILRDKDERGVFGNEFY